MKLKRRCESNGMKSEATFAEADHVYHHIQPYMRAEQDAKELK